MSPVSTSSSANKWKENTATNVEKPNQPPPQIPPNSNTSIGSRPIGFNLSSLGVTDDEREDTPSAPPQPSPPYPTTDNFPELPSQKSSTLVGPTTQSTTKPTVPRKPANGIAAQLSKFQNSGNSSGETTSTSPKATTAAPIELEIHPPPSKPSSEITSL